MTNARWSASLHGCEPLCKPAFYQLWHGIDYGINLCTEFFSQDHRHTDKVQNRPRFVVRFILVSETFDDHDRNLVPQTVIHHMFTSYIN